LIRDFGICIGARDRVFVVGPNGRGKTTLLKLLAGALTPDSGTISGPQAVAAGYFEQTNVQSLVPSNTVLEEIASGDASIDPAQARRLAGLMMFEEDNALKKIAVLSGGEKSRVLLGKLIATPFNLLLLDEPTNHLDLESSDALLTAIDNFPGAVVMVTHNEMFLDALAERLIVFQNGAVTVFEGSYERFLERVGWSGEEDRGGVRPSEAPVSSSPDIPVPLPPSRKEVRKMRSDVIVEKSRVLRPLEKHIAELEKSIEAAESEQTRMNAEIVTASQSKDGARIVVLSKTIHQVRRMIDAYFEEMEPLLGDYEKKKAAFDQRLAELDVLD
jgi:ATP-binding cassette subfamily F protein 3